MRLLTGSVSSRFKAAGPNLKTVEAIILERTGLQSMAYGTLNVTLEHDFIVRTDTAVEPHEYMNQERLKLQRCRVRGQRMFIMRPHTHEPPYGSAANVLELISPIKLREEWGLVDGDILEIEIEGDEAWWNAPEQDPTERAV